MLPAAPTATPYLTSLVDYYNRLLANHADPKALTAVLDEIDGLVQITMSGRAGLKFLQAVARERAALHGNAGQGPPPPQQPPPQQPPPPSSRGGRRGNADRQERNWQQRLQALQALYGDFARQYEKGKDLIYGLAGPRGDYVLAVTPNYDEGSKIDLDHLRMQPNHDLDFLIIDTFNNAFLGTDVLASANAFLPPDQRLDASKLVQSQHYLGEIEGEHPGVKGFREYLEGVTLYDIDSVRSSSARDVKMRLGRASKAGIAHTLTKGGKVHFVLDGLDFGRVLGDLQKDKGDRDITGKELRWLFRNRGDDRVENGVVFWEKGQMVDAPWNRADQRDAWDAYDQDQAARSTSDDASNKAFGEARSSSSSLHLRRGRTSAGAPNTTHTSTSTTHTTTTLRRSAGKTHRHNH